MGFDVIHLVLKNVFALELVNEWFCLFQLGTHAEQHLHRVVCLEVPRDREHFLPTGWAHLLFSYPVGHATSAEGVETRRELHRLIHSLQADAALILGSQFIDEGFILLYLFIKLDLLLGVSFCLLLQKLVLFGVNLWSFLFTYQGPGWLGRLLLYRHIMQDHEYERDLIFAVDGLTAHEQLDLIAIFKDNFVISTDL